MEIAAIIALREGFGTVQLAAFIEIASFIHLAKAGNKFEAAFFFTQLTDATLGIGIIKFILALAIFKFPVEGVFRVLACLAFSALLILCGLGKEGAFLIFMRLHHKGRIEHRRYHFIHNGRSNAARLRLIKGKYKRRNIKIFLKRAARRYRGCAPSMARYSFFTLFLYALMSKSGQREESRSNAASKHTISTVLAVIPYLNTSIHSSLLQIFLIIPQESGMS